MFNSVTPWTAAHQASLSFTISWSLPKLTVLPSTISFCIVPFSSLPQSFPASRSFPVSLWTVRKSRRACQTLTLQGSVRKSLWWTRYFSSVLVSICDLGKGPMFTLLFNSSPVRFCCCSQISVKPGHGILNLSVFFNVVTVNGLWTHTGEWIVRAIHPLTFQLISLHWVLKARSGKQYLVL